jgi:glycerophosphoryl diester phosphodiesterase
VAAPRPQIVAHRGASREAPENTLAAYRRALAIGVDAVELDVHLAADGEAVVIHDFVLGRTVAGSGPVGELTLADLRRLDAGRWFGEAFAGERIPTLAEALDLLRGVRVIVEIKNGPIYYRGIAGRVVAEVRNTGHPAVTVSSFDHPVLREVARLAPDLPTAILYSARPIDPVRLARDAGARLLHPQWTHLTPDAVAAAHSAGLGVETWTVDDPDHLERVLDTGVDAVMSNYPGRVRAALAARGFSLPPPQPGP